MLIRYLKKELYLYPESNEKIVNAVRVYIEGIIIPERHFVFYVGSQFKLCDIISNFAIATN